MTASLLPLTYLPTHTPKRVYLCQEGYDSFHSTAGDVDVDIETFVLILILTVIVAEITYMHAY
jgi:hypothetical protein